MMVCGATLLIYPAPVTSDPIRHTIHDRIGLVTRSVPLPSHLPLIFDILSRKTDLSMVPMFEDGKISLTRPDQTTPQLGHLPMASTVIIIYMPGESSTETYTKTDRAKISAQKGIHIDTIITDR